MMLSVFFVFLILVHSKVRRNIGYGRNTNGILGQGDRQQRPFPVDVGAGDIFTYVQKPFQSIWSGGRRTFLKGNGTLYGFGSDHSCSIGFGDVMFLNTFPSPRELPHLSLEYIQTEIMHISAIADHTVVLGANGAVWVYGANPEGALANPEVEQFICVPRKIVEYGAIDVSAGECNTMIVMQDYTVFGAGCNGQYEIGIADGNQTYPTLTKVPFPESVKVKNVSSGRHYSVFLTTVGELYFSGKISCETNTKSFTRKGFHLILSLEDIGSPIQSIHAGYTHFVGFLHNGSVFAFGCDDYGVLGPDKKHRNFEPIILDTSYFHGGVKKLAAGDCSTALLTKNGEVYFMGQAGLMPTPNIMEHFTRLSVDNEFIVDIGDSWDHFVAISDQDEMYCMGENFFFQCGIIPNIPYVDYQKSSTKVFLEQDIFTIEMCTAHSFGITSKGKAFAYGVNSYGQLGVGTGSYIDFQLPYPVFEISDDVFIIGGDVNLQTSIFLTDSGDLYVVGNGEWGCLGLGNEATHFVPQLLDKKIYFHNQKIRSVRNDKDHVHAVTETGDMYSWGNNEYGAIGLGKNYNTNMIVLTPVRNFGFDGPIRTFSAGVRSVVAVSELNTVYYWGQISEFNSSDVIYTPTIVQDLEFDNGNYTFVEAGNSFMVAGRQIKGSHIFEIYIWGQIGDEDNLPIVNLRKPKRLYRSNVRFAQCIAKYHLICINVLGEVFGLGNNQYHQLSVYLPKKYYHNFTKIPVSKMTNYEIYGFSHAAISDFSTVLQEYVHCYGILDSEYNVCSSNGICTENNTCRCNSGWCGLKCERYKCAKGNQTDFQNCNGHGDCVGPGKCRCESSWANHDQDMLQIGDFSPYGYCSYPICPSTNNKICSGNGKCEVKENEPHCSCFEEYKGSACELDVCNGVDSYSYNDNHNNEDDGCGKYGKCIGYDHCECALSGLNILLPLQSSPIRNKGCIASSWVIVLYCFIVFGVSYLLYYCCCAGFCFCCFCRQWNIGRKLEKKSKKIEENLLSNQEKERHRVNFYNYKSPFYNPNYDFDGGQSFYDEIDLTDDDDKNKVEKNQDDDDAYQENRFQSATEATILLDNDGVTVRKQKKLTISCGKYHIFCGDPYHGEGTIYYVDKRKKQYPVFRGNFVIGKKNGYGVEYHRHFFERNTLPRSFYSDVENFRYSGFYKDDYRHGKGTEYDGNGNKTLIGEYKEGMLLRIQSIDYPVEVFDLQEDIVYSDQQDEILILGSGGFSRILAGKLKKDGRDVAVKIYKDRWEEQKKAIQTIRHQKEMKRRENILRQRSLRKKSEEDDEEEMEGEVTQENDHSQEQQQHQEDEIGEEVSSEFSYISKTYGGGGMDIVKHQKFWETKRMMQSVGNVIKILSMFKHPNVVSIIGWSGPVLEIAKFGYIMEQCVGSVRQRVSDKDRPSLSMKEKNRILYQTALGMSHVHSVMGLIHRDLKWGNVLLNTVDQPKICDFDMSDRDEMNFSGKKNLGGAQGSCFHIAPECLVSHSFDYKCDVYAFGIMMFEIIFEKMDDPFDIVKTSECHVCKDRFPLSQVPRHLIQKYLLKIMEDHYFKCKIRPRVDESKIDYIDDIMKDPQKNRVSIDYGKKMNDQPKEEEEEEGEEEEMNKKRVRVYRWQVELMMRCWSEVAENRPSFNQIVDVFIANHAGKERKRKYGSSISSFGSTLSPISSTTSSSFINTEKKRKWNTSVQRGDDTVDTVDDGRYYGPEYSSINSEEGFPLD